MDFSDVSSFSLNNEGFWLRFSVFPLSFSHLFRDEFPMGIGIHGPKRTLSFLISGAECSTRVVDLAHVVL